MGKGEAKASQSGFLQYEAAQVLIDRDHSLLGVLIDPSPFDLPRSPVYPSHFSASSHANDVGRALRSRPVDRGREEDSICGYGARLRKKAVSDGVLLDRPLNMTCRS